MQNRRTFIKQITLGSIGLTTLSSFDLLSISKNSIKLTVLHTNDMHSRIDAFPANHKKYPDKGGILKLSTLINNIKNQEANVLTLDAGDIFQGTPYFNLYGGEPELKLMSQIGYDAATMGNHDFDNGLDGFNRVLPNANFPFLCANYDFKNTVLEGKTTPYTIIEKGGIKIGIFGIGIKLDGLVDKRLYKETKYLNPIELANHYATLLKQNEKCNLIICLSHLGYEYKDNKLSDKKLAQQTEHIDLIIGGHTHTFLEKAETFFNKKGKPVLVNQAGWSALSLGRVDFYFEPQKSQKSDFETYTFFTKNYDKI